MQVDIKCPRCNQPMEAEAFGNAYCPKCDVTFEAETVIYDMITGEFTYTLTGRSVFGKEDH